ncbi:C3a anaphylatoxin chemotactic receptor-like [Garra rufa]|uniref:C3a anaphylatoxin chemotactic receptor-like n=1 Tax=Garra rufa TaxID=137080 RepID=UPI003CCEC9C0
MNIIPCWYKTNNLSAGLKRQSKIKTWLVPVHQQLIKWVQNTSFGAQSMTRSIARNTTTENKDDLKSFVIVLICIYIPTFVVGLIGNGLVIFLTGCRMKTTVNSIWFLNLAVADFIYMLSRTIQLLLWLVKNHNCFIFFVTFRLNLFSSIFFLVVISLDRCLCTWMVVWTQNKRTLLRTKIICMVVWISSISFSIPFFNIYDFSDTLLITYEFTVGFFIPFLIIASSYIAIGVRIKRFKSGKRLRSYRVIITVILAFFICWFPYYVCRFYLLTVELHTQEVFQTAYAFSAYLVYLNSCLNPILYVFMCDEYKKKLKQSLLLVLETAFAEDHLDFKANAKGQAEQENQTELLDM